MNNIYIKLINWSDEEIEKLTKFLDATNVNWITQVTEGSS